MADTWVINEGAYFLARDIELRRRLREKLERAAAEAKAKRAIAERLGTDDQALVDRMHALGIDGRTAPALHLLPLVETAWADGSASARERAAVLRAAAAHGIKPGSDAGNFLAALLERRPADELVDEVMAVLRDILRAKALRPAGILEACETVADASGGLLGIALTVSDDERRAIARVADALSAEANQRVTNGLS